MQYPVAEEGWALVSALPKISFEFFPPKSPKAAAALWQSVERLAPLAPDFVSVTYGAGGTTRDRTMSAILAMVQRANLEVAGHLTCVGASRDSVLRVAQNYLRLGCRKIVALRGDPPEGHGHFTPELDGFESSIELIKALADVGEFDLFVGAYPEKHPEAADHSADIAYLKRKVDAGATAAITQFFFENEIFLRFRDACVAAGIDIPILPGILPVDDFDKMVSFAGRCGTSVPGWMHDAYANADDRDAHDLLSLAIASEQCEGLMREGVDHIHIYTLNKPDLPFQLCQAIGVEPHQAGLAIAGG
ncbi:MAG: methylenetetrahydrofolate reductase [NAD(P)H] [Pseudomonadota bacterium]